MRKTIDILVCTFVMLTIICLACTLLTTYHFVGYNKYFNNYFILEITLALTMLLWGINMYFMNIGKKKIIYSSLCILIAVGSMFFMFSNVQ